MDAANAEGVVVEVDDQYVGGLIPARLSRSKKGDNGVVLVVGGSKIYHGAPLLASLAAYRSGVDLVYVAVPEGISPALRAYSPSLIVLPLPDAKLTKGAVNRLKGMLPKRVDAAAIGMGLSVSRVDALKELVMYLAESKSSIVLDAGALIPEILPVIKGRRVVVTPHAGEFRRLFGCDAGADEQERVESVRREAERHGITILLKGWVDVISDGSRVAVNRTHTSAMTVGGTGDLLSGLLAGLLAKGLEPFHAAASAAYINGSAGMNAYRRLGLHIMPTDMVDEIAYVMKEYDRILE
ncbi:MAG: NAD(P)H-hydrate dehydratase [Candidatus Nitrosocaldus sp.]|nr:NAD(P)H-hydrate dehydratase [Candidatus Nitrosocaldus sp.]MCS7140633.1 NAD(P)H-hydrate dehydratase [Candidatus Nitrosocaldus sp.]MDW7999552.1 NAD(P)H-hydrate dehydratase [Candidatus Nitrosocaldus sp.]MDW8276356.1 NAD(P)H-hydrate dehydratase [Candidatus Nitrosocaldus sp.]